MTEPMRFLRVNVSGHISLNTALEPGRIHIEMSDSLGAPGLRWFVTPCDLARYEQCFDAAISHYQTIGNTPPPPEPPPADGGSGGNGGGEEPATAPITSISNANPALVTLSASDFALFADVTDVTIAGNSITDANGIVTLSAPDAVAYTYDIGLDLSLEAAPGTGGTITENQPVARSSKRKTTGKTAKRK